MGAFLDEPAMVEHDDAVSTDIKVERALRASRHQCVASQISYMSPWRRAYATAWDRLRSWSRGGR